MSQTSAEQKSEEDTPRSTAEKVVQQAPLENDVPLQRGQTVQMNPAILGQAANMNPDSDMFKQLDAASQLLEHAASGSEAPSGGADATDPTIEEYMTALLARSRNPGAAVEELLAGKELPASVKLPDVVVPQVKPAVEITGPAANIDASADDTPWTQVSPPDSRDAISELRELANISARSSFNVHRGQQLVYEMHNKLSVSLVALVVSFALTSLSTNARSPAFFAAIASLIVAMSWTVKYFQLGRQLHRLCFAGKESE